MTAPKWKQCWRRINRRLGWLNLRGARETALNELAEEARAMGADGVIGIDLDYEVLGKEGSMLMVSASGTAVKLS